MQNEWLAKADAGDMRVSYCAENLVTGAQCFHEPDRRVQTASTIKLAILVALHGEVDEGRLDWSEQLTLTPATRAAGSGVLLEMADGLALTVQDAARLMIVQSDNTATNLLLDRIGTDTVNDWMDRLTLPEIRSLRRIGGGGESRAFHAPQNAGFGIGVATPGAMVRLLKQIFRGEAVSAAASAEILAVLKRQQHGDGIRRAFPALEVANKPGALDHLRSDVGIVFMPGGPVAVAITCDQIPEVLWSPDNPALIFIARLTRGLCENLTACG